jgi:hypothetical protein
MENSLREAGIHVQIQILPFSLCIFIWPSFTSSPKHRNLAVSTPASTSFQFFVQKMATLIDNSQGFPNQMYCHMFGVLCDL